MSNFIERLRAIEDRIQRACDRSGRDRADIHLVAVSKTVAVSEIMRAYEAGIREFGESRWQEMETKN